MIEARGTMDRIRPLLVSLTVLLAPAVAAAHPGHGDPHAPAVAHHLLEPEHAVALAFSLLVGVIGVWFAARSSTSRGARRQNRRAP